MRDTITLETIQRDQAREESITRIVSVAGITCGVALLFLPWVFYSFLTIQIHDVFFLMMFAPLGALCALGVLAAPFFLSEGAMRVAYRGHPVIAEFIGYVVVALDLFSLLIAPAPLCGFLWLVSHYENSGRHQRAAQVLSIVVTLSKFAPMFSSHVRLLVKAGHMQTLYYKGDYQRSKHLALEVINETNENYARKPNAKTHEVLGATQSLALRLLKEMGGAKEAEPYWKKLSEMPDFSRESKVSSLVYVYCNLGYSALAFDDFDKAVMWLNKGLECHALARGTQGMLGELLVNLAFAHLGKGEIDEAEKFAYKSYRVRSVFAKETTPAIADVRLVLGKVDLARGKYDSAEPYLQAAVLIRKARLGANNPDTAAALDAYAECLNKLGKLHEAEAVESEAKQIRAFHSSSQISSGIAGGAETR